MLQINGLVFAAPKSIRHFKKLYLTILNKTVYETLSENLINEKLV